MKDNDIRNSEFEDVLRSKMDELASSVDCFDKISKRAFPQQSSEYSDSEFIVSDLENVTGKRKFSRFIPAVAIAAAAAVCVFVLPKNESFMNFVYSNIGQSDKDVFRGIISEIKEETEAYNYSSYDFTLDEYIRNDVLITPLFSCPFEDTNKDNINVRIYVKMCGETPTNQVYAVEYEGDYEDNNFIAAAESKAKFTAQELENFEELASYNLSPLTNHDSFGTKGASITDSDGEPITMAAFNYNCFFKSGEEIYELNNQIIYYHKNSDTEDSEYLYDMIPQYTQSYKQGEFDESNFNDPWENVVYYSGNSAEADEKQSSFTKTDFIADTYDGEAAPFTLWLFPFAEVHQDIANADMTDTHITVTADNSGDQGSILPPLIPSLREMFRIYVPDCGESFTVTSENEKLNLCYPYSYISDANYVITALNEYNVTESNVYNSYMNAEANRQIAEAKAARQLEEQIQAEIAALEEQQAKLREEIEKQTQIAETEYRMSQLDSELLELREQLRSAEEQLAANEAELNALADEDSEQKTQLETENSMLNQRIAELLNKIDLLKAETDALS
ncbi:MAG: hypothetical protein IJX77_01975 [Ruminococcus sp.]|nr:hypothetical protein [Ruminococcus sp.]